MLPEQIADGWNVLERIIKEALPPIADNSQEKMNNILTSLLTRKMICWVSYQDQGKVEVDTIILTSVIMDEISGTISLLIYAANMLQRLDSKLYEDMIDTLKRYAKSKKCDKIVGYVSDPNLSELIKKYGGDCSYQLMTFNLGEK